VARLVALRSLAGLLSPVFSPVAERFGRRTALLLAMVVFSLGSLVVVSRPGYWPLGITLILIAVAKVIYDPALQAYVGDVVPYAQRGRAIAVTEFSWAGALLLGAPFMGWVIQRQGWYAPFAWLAAGGLVGIGLLWLVMPPGRVASAQANNLRRVASVVRHHPIIWVTASYIFLMMAGNEVMLINYGNWIETSFKLSLTSLGLAASVIGSAEISGEIVAGLAVDRFGKRPIIITTGLLASLFYLGLPYTSLSLATALVTLFLLFFVLEITIVGGIPLFTELLPQARSVLLSFSLAAAGLGRVSGALLGPLVWNRFGLPGVGVAAALITLLGTLILVRWIRDL
jgi:predicted MFS family arabinose efflux permease